MASENYKVLIVDDEEDILEFLSYSLTKDGFITKTAKSGYDAINIAKDFIPDVIVLDVMMPGIDGIETCTELRAIDELHNTMIIFLTARNEDYSQIAGFDAGADDYVSKPIKPKVLSSRLNALLRRKPGTNSKQETSDNILVRNGLTIDREKYIVFVQDREVILSKKEFELLYFLASKPNKVFTREEIYSAVWEDGIIVGERTIDVHIRKLRDKLKIDNIKTYKGVGYKYEE